MTRLLDINVLLALVDPAHVHHERAHRWLDANRQGFRWATCAITENGFCRILSSPSYPGKSAPAVAIRCLDQLRRGLPGHEFWTCGFSLADGSRFQLDLVQGSKQLTDIYLLGLAVEEGGRFVTFDQRVRGRFVAGSIGSEVELL